MNKGLEALSKIAKRIGTLKVDNNGEMYNSLGDMYEPYKTIEKELKRLEAIDNTNPSEALNKLKENAEMFDEIAQENNHSYKDDTVVEAFIYHSNNLSIEQALIKAQEQEKVLEIIKLKRVSIPVIFEFDTYDDYWEWAYSNVIRLYLLSREEFNFLKKVFCND